MERRGRVIVVNGPPGVGKTTVGRRIAAASPNGVFIEGDTVKAFVVTRDEQRPRGLAYRAIAALTDVYLQAGYERVVVDFVFEDAAEYQRLRGAITDTDAAVELFTLWAPLEVVVEREAARPHRDRLGPRVAQCWAAIRAQLDVLGTVIDATGPVRDVAAEIETRLR